MRRRGGAAAPSGHTRRRRAAAAVVVAAVALCVLIGAARSTSARGVGVVSVAGPDADPLLAAAPPFTVTTAGFAPEDPVVAVTLELSATIDFSTPLIAEITVAAPNATLALERPLPERVTVYWRARARTASGAETLSSVTGPRTTATWLVLLSPNAAGGSTVHTRRPTFVWHSAPVTTPPGPWRYDVTVVNVGTGMRLVARDLVDTTFTPEVDLQANTSYRWSVVARLATGDSAKASSLATFVIAEEGAPPATVLYQNFPNPFPATTAAGAAAVGNAGSGSVGATCLWFDLAHPSAVSLEIFSLRGDHVRTLLPNRTLGGLIPAGRYGRAPAAGGASSGCDPQLAWDGTSDDGRVVPPGVYLARLVADRTSSVRKIVFRGR